MKDRIRCILQILRELEGPSAKAPKTNQSAYLDEAIDPSSDAQQEVRVERDRRVGTWLLRRITQAVGTHRSRRSIPALMLYIRGVSVEDWAEEENVSKWTVYRDFIDIAQSVFECPELFEDYFHDVDLIDFDDDGDDDGGDSAGGVLAPAA